jgi:Helix-turn-helix domain of resolvase
MMTSAERHDTVMAFREAQKISSIHLETWLRTKAPAALERLATARQAEDELLRVILAEDYGAIASKPPAGRKLKLDPDQIEDARRRRGQGESMTSIARGLGVSGHTIRRWVGIDA